MLVMNNAERVEMKVGVGRGGEVGGGAERERTREREIGISPY